MLTIITVNLNNSLGLESTIKSVLSQETVDFEFIIVDGKSTDGSLCIINHYLKENELKSENKEYNICLWKGKCGDIIGSYFYQKDKGVYDAMNKGIKASNGDYLLFLNSGDLLVESDLISDFYRSNDNYDLILGKTIISQLHIFLVQLDLSLFTKRMSYIVIDSL